MIPFGVGDDGKVLRFGDVPSGPPNDMPFAPGVIREKYDGSKTLNGVARTRISGEEDERLLAVGDDGTALIRTREAFKTDDDLIGGPLWVKRTTGIGCDPDAVSLARGTRAGWAVGDKGTILGTTNSGSSCGIQASHTTRHSAGARR